MSASLQASAYWEGYVTGLLQDLEYSVSKDLDPNERKSLLLELFSQKLTQHGLGHHWVDFFFGE